MAVQMSGTLHIKIWVTFLSTITAVGGTGYGIWKWREYRWVPPRVRNFRRMLERDPFLRQTTIEAQSNHNAVAKHFSLDRAVGGSAM